MGQIINTMRFNRNAVDIVKFADGGVSTEFSIRTMSQGKSEDGSFEKMSRNSFFVDVKIRTKGHGFALEAGDYVKIYGYWDIEEWSQTVLEFVFQGEGSRRVQQFADAANGKRIPLVTERSVKRRKSILSNIQWLKRLDAPPEWWNGAAKAETVVTGVAEIPLDQIAEAASRRNGGAKPALQPQTAEV